VPTRARSWLVPLVVLGSLAGAYFIAYPEDLAAVLAPVERVLAVSLSASPWLYGLLAVVVLCWTALRICGERPRGTPPDQPPGLVQPVADRADG
jgi:hypothetical protein